MRDQHLAGGGVGAVAGRSGHLEVGQDVLIVDGDDGKLAAASGAAGERLEVGDDQVDAALVDDAGELLDAARGLARLEEAAGQGAVVAHRVVHVGEAEAVDLQHLADVAQVAQAAVERGGDDAVSLALQVKDDLARAGGVSRAFAVDSVQDVCHCWLEV